MGFGKKKTYVSASVSNLLGDSLEARYTKGAVIEATLSNLPSIADHIVKDTLIPGAGTRYNNFVSWCDHYKYDGKPFRQHYGIGQSVLYITPKPSDELVQQILKRELNYNPEPIEEPKEKEFIFKGYKYDEKNKIHENLIDVKIKSKVTKVQKHKYLIATSEPFDPKKYALVHAYNNLLDREKLELKHYLLTGETTYELVDGNELTDDEGTIFPGTANDAYVQLGYSYPEPQKAPDPNNPTEIIEFTKDVFYADEAILVESKKLLDQQYPNASSSPALVQFISYIYTENYIDRYEMDGDYIVLDENNRPILVPDSTPMMARYYYTITKDVYDGIHEEYYTTTVDLDSIKPYAIYIPYTLALEDNLLKELYVKPEPVSFQFVPFICLRDDKRWLNNSNASWWYKLNKKALRKLTLKNNYIDEIYDNLYGTANIGETAWIYIVQGIPINLCQLHYCARYALQFFKMLLVPNWENLEIGEEFYRDIGNSSVALTGRFNFRFYCGWSRAVYASGSGTNPIDPSAKTGKMYFKFKDNTAYFIRQITLDAWEYAGVAGIYNTYANIKNGKSHTFSDPLYWANIWDKKNRKRKYSSVLLPLSKSVSKHIPLAHWTDCVQYGNNIVCTSYKVVKKSFLGGIFSFILLIVGIVIFIAATITTGGIGGIMSGGIGGAIAGLLGNQIFASIAAVAISYVAAIAVKTLISPIIVKVFGNFWGKLLTGLTQLGLSIYMLNLSGFNINLDTLTSPLTLLSMATSVTFSILNMNLASAFMEFQLGMQAKYNRLEQLQKQSEEVFNSTGFSLYQEYNYLSQKVLSSLYGGLSSPVESCDNFIRRSLLTGSDYFDQVYSYIEEYVDNMLYLQTEV